ncbi:glycosyltransferase [Corynebacterium heidelbergense]|uniref:Erythromycin biosynthesis protein CIII-like C-terminal domain-containing protein n=1 Tax=Corynebacterium heidelbergense TaxID=2055947 RepID=A0A364V3C6_9CORY|nr:nucleotide disphospho-sugar-binding domain-containing protein [Corynebacterium heidelbergense]RAV31131.1 hypothetical protein DLJ54_10000 [Corynebacterium heidelbergense]
MSTIAVMTSPAKGHLYPLMETLLELRDRGHNVVVRTLGSEVTMLNNLGFKASALSEDLNSAELEDWDASNPLAALNAVLQQLVSRMPHDCAELKELIAQENPDMVMVDFTTFGGQIAAEASGLPWALWSPTFLPLEMPDDPPFGLGLRRATGLRGKARDKVLRRGMSHLWDRFSLKQVNEMRVKNGLGKLRHTTDLLKRPPAVINFTAEPFEYARKQWPENLHLVGPGNWSPPNHDGPDLSHITDPIALVTCSTEFQDDAELGQAAIDALKGTGMHTVVTAGALDPLTFRPGEQATVLDFVSHDAILPRCAIVISHGGMGITQKALSHGLPIVVVPFGRDQKEVAERVRACGAGEVLSTKYLTPERLHAKVTAAMARSGRATKIAKAFEKAGGAQHAANVVEDQLNRA